MTLDWLIIDCYLTSIEQYLNYTPDEKELTNNKPCNCIKGCHGVSRLCTDAFRGNASVESVSPPTIVDTMLIVVQWIGSSRIGSSKIGSNRNVHDNYILSKLSTYLTPIMQENNRGRLWWSEALAIWISKKSEGAIRNG